MGQKIAVFDLDGTLVNTAPDLLDSLNHTLAHGSIAPVPEEAFSGVVGQGGRAMIAKAYAAQKRALPGDEHERLFGLFLQHYGANIPGRSQPYPGVIAALDRFAAAGYILAVCTNKTEALSRALLGALGMTDRFAAICGLDTFGISKPDPRHILETIKLAGGDPQQAIMVGDSRADIEAAKAGGIPVVAVDFGYTDRHVREFEPTVIISHFDALTVPLAEKLIAAYA